MWCLHFVNTQSSYFYRHWIFVVTAASWETSYNYRASQVLRAATDGCLSQRWLPGLPTIGSTYWRCSQTLSVISVQFLIWCFFSKNLTSTVDFSILYGACFFESFSLSPNCTGIRHRSSWKLYSKFVSCRVSEHDFLHFIYVLWIYTLSHNENSCLGMSQIAIIITSTLIWWCTWEIFIKLFRYTNIWTL